MTSIMSNIIDGYFASEQHEKFLGKNNADEEIRKLRNGLAEILKGNAEEDIEDEINNFMFGAFNTGEYYGIMQGIGIGLQLLQECT